MIEMEGERAGKVGREYGKGEVGEMKKKGKGREKERK